VDYQLHHAVDFLNEIYYALTAMDYLARGEAIDQVIARLLVLVAIKPA